MPPPLPPGHCRSLEGTPGLMPGQMPAGSTPPQLYPLPAVSHDLSELNWAAPCRALCVFLGARTAGTRAQAACHRTGQSFAWLTVTLLEAERHACAQPAAVNKYLAGGGGVRGTVFPRLPTRPPPPRPASNCSSEVIRAQSQPSLCSSPLMQRQLAKRSGPQSGCIGILYTPALARPGVSQVLEGLFVVLLHNGCAMAL